MAMNENKEVFELTDITVSRVIEQLGDPNLLASKLVKRLGELIKHDSAEDDIGFDRAKYHATRLAVELDSKKSDSDKDRRYINRIWKDLVEAFEVIQPSIENDARKAKYRKILKPRKTDPKTGRVEFYFEEVELETSDLSGDKQTQAKDGKPLVHYERTKNPKPSFIGKLFSKILLTRKTFVSLYAALPMAILLIWYFWYQYLSYYNDGYITNGYFLFTFIGLLSAWIFRAYYFVESEAIVKAPMWVGSFSGEKHVQLELRKSEKLDRDGHPIPEIGLTIYKSKCLVCGSTVVVDNGIREFKGRLIGKCTASPREHIYSFDHITQKGVPLRSDTYLG
ncbi:MAG: hypothetical protein MK096_00710 [Oleiphilaceae bacterium]|nr:hypothetical protein [Oleiphilaceae bacterium]